MLISEFNEIINNEIKDQPTPFIYERLGEKFKHYFIDEFQDTSELQWENLISLLDNSLATETGSAMIVGDAKQAIYRWRGGKPELFIGLFNEDNPFQIEKTLHHLPTNYRSCNSIINFNNGFFKHLSSFAFENEQHKELYIAAEQKQHLEEEGYVNLNFLEFEKDDDRDVLFPVAVLKTVETVLLNGFELRDICILVRKKKEGVVIADYLSEHGIDIISSETLLINRSPKVNFITTLLKLNTLPEDKELKVDALFYIADLLNVKDVHGFISSHLPLGLAKISEALKNYNIDFNFSLISQYSLYNATEYIIKAFNLVETSNAYVQFFLDVVLEYSQKHSSQVSDFLTYWEKKKESLSITIPEGQNAVQIMTIHKSKGLEFPVVIFPYADLNIYREKEPKVWFPVNENEFNGFSYSFLNYNKDIANYGETGMAIYKHHQSELELDNINLLYVILTRPVEQLYIISKKDLDTKGNEKLNEFSGLFINYLKSLGLWSDTKNNYNFGNPLKSIQYEAKAKSALYQKHFISNLKAVNIVTNSGYLWNTAQEAAIEKGNLIHNLMSRIKTHNDIEFALKDALADGLIGKEQANSLRKTLTDIANHKELKAYFSNDLIIYNERDVISSIGTIIRPDRLVIDKENNATLIDYKTGSYNTKHVQQLQGYQDIIETMDLKVSKKILVYINDVVEIKEI